MEDFKSNERTTCTAQTSAEMAKMIAETMEMNPYEYSFANTQFFIIQKYVLDFQMSLDEEHDIGLLLTNFGQTMLMEVTQIGFEKSVLMIFKGFVDGRPSTLIQHINQLNFLLTSVPKAIEQPKRKIGFTQM